MKRQKAQMVPVFEKTVEKVFEKYAKSRKYPAYLIKRSQIALYAAKDISNQDISDLVGLHPNSVGKWRKRIVDGTPLLNTISRTAPKAIDKTVRALLSDEYRSGTPPTYSSHDRDTIKLIACNNPRDYGYTISHWSLSFLREAVIKEIGTEEIKNISTGGIYNILCHDNLRPWEILDALQREVRGL